MKNKRSVGKIISQYSYIFVFLLILLAYRRTVMANGNKFTFSHISAILGSQQTAIIGTIALGMAFIIITGQIDLSVGSSLVLCTGVSICVFNMTNSVILMLLAAVASGCICGAINGMLVGFGKMPPFVVTLGTMLIYRSLSLTAVHQIDPKISGSSSGQFALISSNSKYKPLHMGFGVGKLKLGGFSIPYIFFVFLLMAIILIIVSKKTKYGKSVYAVGSNEKSARLAGINVIWTKISCFILIGALTGVASFLHASKMANVNPASSGQSYEMYAIASVVLAGVNMAGGRGEILGVIFGALSYNTISYIINNLKGTSVDIKNTFQGLVLIIVILIQTAGPAIKESINRARKRRLNAASGK